ncbi:MipA/OmpV family protein [Noviherbaspirillum galbum]|uniref:MipA/OmpV family protein n=1 Tax=Noviherbaspirillum galbum TaxID=2709383 RepID=A0A6B3SIW6_9BURK|nr:MipA/OmpV family protein [Noviherbaspirillum galbum]NEX60528.1 MipA/OmpV family protein [Noviherbaspirillum galbum]
MKTRLASTAMPVLTFLCACLPAMPAGAEALPKWELGLGAAGISLPSYRGSDVQRSEVLPAPYVVYRGERLQADRGGVRAELLRNDLFELNVSANLSLYRTTNDDPARRGMESLRPVAELGPTADFSLWRSADGRADLDFRVPLRAGFTIESSPRHVGWLLAPNLRLRLHDLGGMPGLGLSLQGGPQFADRRWHDYTYGVRPSEATAARPAYAASGGYSGMQVTGTLSRRFGDFWTGAFVRVDSLNGAVFRDSPLVRQNQGVTAGLAVIWVFGKSSTLVNAEE